MIGDDDRGGLRSEVRNEDSMNRLLASQMKTAPPPPQLQKQWQFLAPPSHHS